MSKERALRRAERERAAAEAAAARARSEERRRRRRRWQQRLVGWLPARHSRQTGVLARRRRRQLLTTLVVLVVVNALVWFTSDELGLRLLVLAVTPLAAPVLHTLLFRRT
ncbi:hypothetical protein [Nocardioides sp. SYSU D00038]|uniref:hypothetical protein n=1 Tax=Nocardioides sp. SYSU D00038 TaxID=2812554 RepID=UPI0019680E2F|nr:hypothetical protein [Nocardioides sp. SYSU D00038]